ncbi:MAG: hypothetical protein GF353_20835 [Candidatus Lokiarchaeota archaeon]|nr:hypothetical protein [Candidatus Lokiarchaeota archaeon]
MTVDLTEEDEILVEKLSKTETVKNIANSILEHLSKEELAYLLSIYFLIKLKGGGATQALFNFFTDKFYASIKNLLASAPEVVPELVQDVNFIKIGSKILNRDLDIKELLGID